MEDGEIHRDDQPADHDAQEDDHQRFHQRREIRYGALDLVVVELGDLRQHDVQRPGGFADLNHVADHVRKDPTFDQRRGQRSALADAVARRQHGLLDDAVTGRLGRDRQSVQDRDAGGRQRAQGLREAGHRGLPGDGAEHGQGEDQPVGLPPAGSGPGIAAQQEEGPARTRGDLPEIGRSVFARRDGEAGRERKLLAEAGEHLPEDRDDVGQQQRGHQDGHADDARRIDQGGLQSRPEFGRLLLSVGQPRQDAVERAPEFARGDHADVELAEHCGVLPQRLGERRAALDVAFDLADDPGERPVPGLAGQQVQRLHDGESGVDHRRELAREHDHVRGFHARTQPGQGDFGPQAAGLDPDAVGQRADAPSTQARRNR